MPWPTFHNLWTGAIQMWPGPHPQQAAPPPQALLAQQAQQAQLQQLQAWQAAQAQAPALQAAQAAQAQALQAFQPAPAPASQPASQWAGTPGSYNPIAGLPSWDQQSLASTFSTMTLNQQPQQNEWYFDSGATSHMTSDSRTLSHIFPQRYPFPSAIVVSDGSLLPVTSTGTAHLSGPLHLNNVLVSPKLIKNLISVRQFTSNNNC